MSGRLANNQTVLYAATVVATIAAFGLASAVQSGPPSMLLVFGILFGLPALLIGLLYLSGRRSVRARADLRMGRADAPRFGSADEIIAAAKRERALRFVAWFAWLVTAILVGSIFTEKRVELLAASIGAATASVFIALALVGVTRRGSVMLQRYVEERQSMVCPQCFYDLFPDSGSDDYMRCPECGGSFCSSALPTEWAARDRVSSRPRKHRSMNEIETDV